MEPILSTILSQLREMPEARRTHHYWSAYSGGLDSHVLLHAMARLADTLQGVRISAVHINHRLQAEADQWAQHSLVTAGQLGIECQVIVVDPRPQPGESPEAAARHARYGAMEKLIGPQQILLTAHHQDDQAETLLLQMIRGAGPHGLAAMPFVTRFGSGWLARPLLTIPRDSLHQYALDQGLHWIEDHSNQDRRFSRNYLRHEILPRFRHRWPAIGATLGRVAGHQAEVAEHLDRLAAAELADLSGSQPDTLSCRGLGHLPPSRQRSLLHAWFRHLGLPVPYAVHLQRILTDVIVTASDRQPVVSWKGAEVRRYRDDLYANPPLLDHDRSQVIPWSLERSLCLPHGRLEARRVIGTGLRAAVCPGGKVEVRFRQGGERCRVGAPGRARPHTSVLKKLFQERGIAPWQRDRIPLIFIAGQLAAVAGLWLCHSFAAGSDEPGWELRWVSFFHRQR